MSKAYSFYLNGKPLNAKKLKSTETLDNVRKLLKNKIDSTVLFFKNEMPIDINDENEFTLEDIEDKGKIYLMNDSSNTKSFEVYLNNQLLTKYEGNDEEKIIKIRKHLGNQMSSEAKFLLQNETVIENEDEDGDDGFKISDIIKDNIIYIIDEKKIKKEEKEIKEIQKSKEMNNVDAKIEKEKNNKTNYLFFNENNKKKIISISFSPEDPLYSVRKKLKQQLKNFENFVFINNEKEITKEEEFELEIQQISEDGIIFLKQKLNDDDETPDITNKQVNDNSIKKEKIFSFQIENGINFMKSFNPNINLSTIREEIPIADDMVFVHDGFEINKKDENQFTLSLIENKSIIKIKKTINIKQNNGSNAAPLIKNEPIKGSKLLGEQNGLKIYKYPEIQFNDEEEIRAISLMVVGQTGSGKTTLLNSLVNFVLNIQLEDDFRYKIIVEENDNDQSKSVTRYVNVYRIASHGNYPPLKIIDSPGYGDTGGIKRDYEITELIKQKFEKEIDSIHAICFVAQSSNARLTVNQKYIFDSIINLFGNDIAENFIIMMTFCDAEEPQLKCALLSPESNLRPIIKLIKFPWYLKFNNSAIFASNKGKFNEMFWKLGMESFDEFIKKLLSLTPKSLTLTKEVLNKRKHLKATVEGLIPQLNLGLSKLDSIRQQLDKIEIEKKKIDGSKNFIIENDVPKIIKIDLKQGEHVTNCLTCNYTCHYPCYITDNNKENCSAMNDKKSCTVCTGKCYYTMHTNATFRIDIKMEKEKTTLKDLEKKYYDSKSNKTKFEQIRDGLIKEFEIIQLKCLNIQEDIKKCVDRLKQIGLNSNPFSSSEYIDLLIESEKNQGKPGWQGRIRGLEELKKIHQTIRNAYESKDNNIKEFSEFQQKYLKDLNKKNETLEGMIKGKNGDKNNDGCYIF